MDRLVCGDVGFGKTEVAIRAAFKAIQDGKQVAVLGAHHLARHSTRQHVRRPLRRLPDPCRGCSAASSPTRRPSGVDGLASGEVDCVIGTHRLLQDGVDVQGPRPAGGRRGAALRRAGQGGDEEAARPTSTCSPSRATPIPRTLEMSLIGIRDLSLLQTPPADRQPILTYVGEYDERVAVEALRRELLREGQVFWVHNRVQTIDQCAERLRELVPEARIAVAHGQMDEGTLEQIVVDFWEGRYDVLVCTTIIESGIDMPTVNTLVVERADLLGLGQMHQLRGRVGRSGSAGLRLPVPPRRRGRLTEEAYERLRTIGEATDLGSGFKIAMRDLEIRGAGNLLGESQSGHIAAVGYDLYCQMVTEAVGEMKGEPPKEPSEVKLDVPTDAYLPVDYVTKEESRLEAYRRLAAVTTAGEVDDIRTEWEDRYGPVPPPADALLTVGYLRAECHRLGVRDVSIASNQARLAPLDPQDQRRDAPAAAVARCDLQARLASAGRPDPARRRAGRVPRRVPPRARAGAMRLQIAKPAEHVALVDWPYLQRLDDWTIPGLQEVTGLHRHVVRLVEAGDTTYVVKELPDPLGRTRVAAAARAGRRRPADGRGGRRGHRTRRDDADGLLITRHIDYSLPYRVLLSGRGLQIPYLGERVLDALAGLLVRLHLAGFYWGDCSLSNTLFRRDAGALGAYIIDVETSERHTTLSDGQRRLDLTIATENVAGDLEDLHAGGRLAEGIDPIATAQAIETTYRSLWTELTGADEFDVERDLSHRSPVAALARPRIRCGRAGAVHHCRWFEVAPHPPRRRARLSRAAVEAAHRIGDRREPSTTPAQRHQQVSSRSREAHRQEGARDGWLPRKWLDERFEPTIDGVPPDLVGKLEPAELYHQVLEHRWFLSEAAGGDVGIGEAVTSYVRDVLTPAPDEQRSGNAAWDDDDEADDEAERRSRRCRRSPRPVRSVP